MVNLISYYLLSPKTNVLHNCNMLIHHYEPWTKNYLIPAGRGRQRICPLYQNTIALTFAATPAPTLTHNCLFTLLSWNYNIGPNPPSHLFHFPLLTLPVRLIPRRSSSLIRSDLDTPFSEKRVRPSWANQYLSHHFGLNFLIFFCLNSL
jgi:hypothetical protein